MDLNRKLNKDDYPMGYDMPEYPARVVTTHVVMKGFQVGSILGLVVVMPILRYIKKMPRKQAWITSMCVTPFIGAVVTSCLLYKKHLSGELDIAGVDDRAYRIAQGEQPKVDKVTQMGAIMGLAYGAFSGIGLAGSIAASTTAIPVGIIVYKGGQLIKQLRTNT